MLTMSLGYLSSIYNDDDDFIAALVVLWCCKVTILSLLMLLLLLLCYCYYYYYSTDYCYYCCGCCCFAICLEREIMVSHLKCRLLLFARINYKLHNDLLCIYQWRHFLAIDQFLFDSSNIAYKASYDFPDLLNLLNLLLLLYNYSWKIKMFF